MLSHLATIARPLCGRKHITPESAGSYVQHPCARGATLHLRAGIFAARAGVVPARVWKSPTRVCGALARAGAGIAREFAALARGSAAISGACAASARGIVALAGENPARSRVLGSSPRAIVPMPLPRAFHPHLLGPNLRPPISTLPLFPRYPPMPSTYIPSREGDLNNWLENFQARIVAAPASYGLSAGDATAIKNAYDAWHSAFLEAVGPTTRTRGKVLAKNEQKEQVLGIVRGYAATIRADAAVSDTLKLGLGLHVRTVGVDTRIGGGGSSIPAPATAPAIALIGMSQGTHNLRATDRETSSRRAKPAGTVGLLLFRIVADGAVNDPEEARFLSFITRATYQSRFGPEDKGKTATYFARWTNAKGEVGPWSQATSMSIAA